VERLIEERRAQFRRQKELEMEELRQQQRAEEERKAIIEQERRRLLREHATKLLGYLPKVCCACCTCRAQGLSKFRGFKIRNQYRTHNKLLTLELK